MSQERLDSIEEQLSQLTNRWEEMDDVVADRCLAILDAADVVYRKQSERIDRIALQIDRAALQIDRNATAIGELSRSVQQLVSDANADRAVMLEILQYLRNQHPGNGRGSE